MATPTLRCLVCALALALASAQGPDARAQSRACAVHSEATQLQGVTVAPAGGAARFTVELRGAPSVAWPSAQDASAELEVSAPLRFSGSVRSLPLRTTRELTLAEGTLTLAEESPVRRAHALRDGVAAATVELTQSVTLGPLELPCAALSADSEGADGIPDPVTLRAARWEPRGRTLQLYAEAGARRWLEVRVGMPSRLPLVQLALRNEWMQVRFETDNGSQLRGWVRRSQLRVRSSGLGNGSTVGCGIGLGSGPCGGPGEYCGPAGLTRGTTVYAERGRGPWGTVTEEPGFEVHYVTGSPWAEVTAVRGVGPLGGHGFVPASAVVLPNRARTP